MIKAVIFDFDGVLANTMEYHAKAYKQVLSEAGIWIKPRAVYLAEGALPEQMISRLVHNPVDAQVKRLAKKKSEVFRRYRKYIQPNKEAVTLLKKLKKKGLKVGVASGGKKRNSQVILGKTTKLLDFYLGGEDVKKGKPDPEIYINAAKAAGVKPSECVVIENAPNGINAAKAAGMKCIAITTTLTKKDLEEADFVVNTFREVENRIDMIKNLKQG